MLAAGIALLLGILSGCFSAELLDRFWLSWLPLIVFLGYLNPKARWFYIFIAAFLWAQVAIQWQLDHRLQADWNNKRVHVVGEVVNIPERRTHYSNVLIKPLWIDNYSDPYPRLIRLSWRDLPDKLSPGQRWHWSIKLKQPHGYQNPGGFDYERWMFYRGIDASGYVTRDKAPRMLSHDDWNLQYFRMQLLQRIRQLCENCQQSGLISALSLGYRADMPTSTRRLLQQTGTAHLIAISGLHVGIIAGLGYWFGVMLWHRLLYRSRLTRFECGWLSALVMASIYALMSGFDLPAQRALIMLTVLAVSQRLRLTHNLLHSLLLSLMVILILSPLSVLSASLWLTFSALLVVALGLYLIQNLARDRFFRLKSLLIVQGLFSVVFVPVTIAIFGQFHSASFAANLLAVPWVSVFIVPFNFVLMLLLWLPDTLLQWLYGGLDYALSLLISYLQWLIDIGFDAVHVSSLGLWKVVSLVIVVLMVLLPVVGRYRWLLLAGLPVLLLTPAHRLPEGHFRTTVLDVGMGTSIVIETAHHVLLYDFGPGNQRDYSLGEWVVKPYLSFRGLSHVDRLVLSHADQDHVGGLYALAHDYRETLVISGTPEQIKQRFKGFRTVRDCQRLPGWIWDGVEFEFLQTNHLPSDSDNNRSCVLKIRSGSESLLINGDIEQTREQLLIDQQTAKLASTIMTAPHHGSLTSSSAAFIDAVNPQQVIFSVGFNNRWHFPRPEVLHRYHSRGITTHRTDQSGAIQIECSPEACEISSYRQQQRRLWY